MQEQYRILFYIFGIFFTTVMAANLVALAITLVFKFMNRNLESA
jgi:hypothetical protein